MICKCGYQNEPDDFYCAQCGRKLGRKKGGKGWIIATVAVLLVAALAVGAWFLFRGNGSEPEPTETTEGGSNGIPEDPNGARPDKNDDQEELHLDGWNEEKTHYYQDGEPLKGQQQIDGGYYCFSEEDGSKLTGWQQIGDDWYYYTAEGPAPGEGWYENDTGWFYLMADGKQQTEDFQDTNRLFDLDEEGYLVSTTYKVLQCEVSKAPIGEEERDVLSLPGTVTGCKQFDFTLTRAPGIDFNTQPFEATVWVCRNDIWVPVESEEVEVRKSEKGDGFTLTFVEPQDISGIYIGLKNNVMANTLLTNFKAVK